MLGGICVGRNCVAEHTMPSELGYGERENRLDWQDFRGSATIRLVRFLTALNYIAVAFGFLSVAAVSARANETIQQIGNIEILLTCDKRISGNDRISELYAASVPVPLSPERQRSLLVYDAEIPREFFAFGAPALAIHNGVPVIIYQSYAEKDGKLCLRLFYSSEVGRELKLSGGRIPVPAGLPAGALAEAEKIEDFCGPLYGTPDANQWFCFLPMSENSSRGFPVEIYRELSSRVRLFSFQIDTAGRSYDVITIGEFLSVTER